MEEIIWDKVKSEFIAGNSLKSLSQKYSVSFSTVKSRHAREGWTQLRKKTKGKMQENIITRIANIQTQAAINSIEVIDLTVKDLLESLPRAVVNSKESLARAIADLLKVRIVITGEATKKEPTIHTDLVYKMVLEAIYKK